MILNLTLVIQIINFYFAYFLLRFFFFTPMLNFIKQDQQQKDLLEQVLSNLEEQLVFEKKKQQKQQTLLKMYFVSNKPNLSDQDANFRRPLKSLPLDIAFDVGVFREKITTLLQERLQL